MTTTTTRFVTVLAALLGIALIAFALTGCGAQGAADTVAPAPAAGQVVTAAPATTPAAPAVPGGPEPVTDGSDHGPDGCYDADAEPVPITGYRDGATYPEGEPLNYTPC